MKVLEAKNLYKPSPSMLTILFSESPFVLKVYTILRCIKVYSKEISCGRDGLCPQHMLDTLCEEGSIVARDPLCEITLVVNL